MFLSEKLYTPILEEEDKKNLVLYNNETFVVGYDEVEIEGKHFYRIPRYYNPLLLKFLEVGFNGQKLIDNIVNEYKEKMKDIIK